MSKHIQTLVSDETHERLVLEALRRKETMQELLRIIINEHNARIDEAERV